MHCGSCGFWWFSFLLLTCISTLRWQISGRLWNNYWSHRVVQSTRTKRKQTAGWTCSDIGNCWTWSISGGWLFPRLSLPACWTKLLPQSDTTSLLTWLSYFPLILAAPSFLHVPWLPVGALPSSSCGRTVTRGDNVSVIGLYLAEPDVMSLNVDKAGALLSEGRPPWVQPDLISQNATVHTSWGSSSGLPHPDALSRGIGDEKIQTNRIHSRLSYYKTCFFVFLKLMMRVFWGINKKLHLVEQPSIYL